MLGKQSTLPNLVCLSGWGFSRSVWDSVIPMLRDSFACIAEDLSCLPSADSPEEALRQWSDELMKRLPSSVAILGWSLGGTLGLWLASRYPNRITAVYVVSGSPCFSEKSDWPGVPLERLETISEAVRRDNDLFLKTFLRWQVSLRDNRALQALRESMIQDKASLMTSLFWLIRLDCRSVNCKQYYLLASGDKVLPTQSLQTSLPPKAVTILQGEHAFWLSSPQALVRWLLEVASA